MEPLKILSRARERGRERERERDDLCVTPFGAQNYIPSHPWLRCAHPGLLCFSPLGLLPLRGGGRGGRRATIDLLLAFWKRFSANQHFCVASPRLRLEGGLRPRFRFASPGVTHGAASPRLTASQIFLMASCQCHIRHYIKIFLARLVASGALLSLVTGAGFRSKFRYGRNSGSMGDVS
jgi:hypothetical protein